MIYRFNPNALVPNNPFYYPYQESLQAGSGPLIVGTGLSLDYTSGIISAPGGGGGTVSVQVTSPIINSGTSSNPNIGIQTATTGQLGAVKVGDNINVLNGVISVRSASPTNTGVVQLIDSTGSTSVFTALTANQGRILQQQIDTLLATGGLQLAGTLNAATSVMETVTAAGAAAGFAVGVNLPVPTPSLRDFVAIVAEPGTYIPPGSTIPVNVQHGDWFICNGVTWQYFDIGNRFPVATETNAGLIQLASLLEVSLGIDATKAVTSASLFDVYLRKTLLNAKGDLISATAVADPSTVTVGASGSVLTANSACPSGLSWNPLSRLTIPCSCIIAKGALLSGSAANVPLALGLGTTNQVLTANFSCPTGVSWVTVPATAIPCACISGKGTILTGLASSTATALPVGPDGQVLVACPTSFYGLAWASSSSNAIPCAFATGKGSLITGTDPGMPASLSPGSDNYVLTACSTCPLGLTWTFNPDQSVPCSCYTGKGVILGATTFAGVSPLSIGTNGQVLCADSTTVTGLKWTTPSYLPCSLINGVGSLVTGDTSGTPTALTPGPNNYSLSACSACPLGLTWLSDNLTIPCSVFNGPAGGQLLTGTGSGIPVSIKPGFTDALLCSNFLSISGLSWFNFSIPVSSYRAKGDLLVGCSAALFCCRLPVGANQTILSADSACGGGLKWSSLTVNGVGGDLPVGTIGWFSSSTPPLGWCVANGQIVNRTVLSSLFVAIGTTYGAGDGTSTFNLPDLRGVWSRGSGCGRTIGSTEQGYPQCHPHTLSLNPGTAGVWDWQRPDFTSAQRTTNLNSAVSCNLSVSSGYTECNTTCAKNTVDNVALLPCIKWSDTSVAPSAIIPASCLTSKGALITATAANTPAPLPLGVDGQTLQVNSACSTGIQWGTALPPGIEGSIAMACTTCPFGFKWAQSRLTYSCSKLVAMNIGLNSIQYQDLTGPLVGGQTYLLNVSGSYCSCGNPAPTSVMCYGLFLNATPDLPNSGCCKWILNSLAKGPDNVCQGYSLTNTFTVPPDLNGQCFFFFVKTYCGNTGAVWSAVSTTTSLNPSWG